MGFTQKSLHSPYRDIKTAFSGACRRAKIEDLTFHSLRHTVGSRLVQHGADIVTVKNLLGHQSITTTQRYTHSGSEQQKEAMELLNSRIEDKSENKAELLRICDMDGRSKNQEALQKLPNHLFSMN